MNAKELNLTAKRAMSEYANQAYSDLVDLELREELLEKAAQNGEFEFVSKKTYDHKGMVEGWAKAQSHFEAKGFKVEVIVSEGETPTKQTYQMKLSW